MTKVYYAGRQWHVTDFGLECLEPYHYDIEASRLGALTDWNGPPCAEAMLHVGAKTWVDVEDFAAAFAVACQVHAGKFAPLPEGAFLEALAGLRGERAHDAIYDEVNPTIDALDAAEATDALERAAKEFERRHPDPEAFKTLPVDWPADAKPARGAA